MRTYTQKTHILLVEVVLYGKTIGFLWFYGFLKKEIRIFFVKCFMKFINYFINYLTNIIKFLKIVLPSTWKKLIFFSIKEFTLFNVHFIFTWYFLSVTILTGFYYYLDSSDFSLLYVKDGIF